MNSTAPGRTFPALLRVIQRVFGKFGCQTSFLISKVGKTEQAFPRQRYLLKVKSEINSPSPQRSFHCPCRNENQSEEVSP